jgi:hypothetical protein
MTRTARLAAIGRCRVARPMAPADVATESAPTDRVAHTAFALLWAVVGGVACATVIGLEPNLVEEGLVIHVAQRLVAGEHLYRDIVFFTGPLPFELLGALFRIFGEEILVGRSATAVVQGVNAALAYGLLRRAGGGALAHAAGALVAALPLLLFPLFSIFYYTPLAFSFGLWTAYAATRSGESARWAVAAGVGVAAVALCKQTLGMVLAVGMLTALFATAAPGQRMRILRSFVLGGVAATLVTLAFYGLRGDLQHLWRCLVTVPLSLGETFSSRYLNLWPPGVLDPELHPHKVVYFPNLYFLKYGIYAPLQRDIILGVQLLYALPILALLATPLARIAGPLPRAAWINAAYLIAMATNLFPRSDWGHLVFSLAPAVMQLMILIAPVLARVPFLRPASAVAIAAAAGWYSLVVGTWVHEEAGPARWGPRVPLRPVSAIYRVVTIPRVIRYIQSRVEPGDPIFVARSEPLLYFATDTTNPTPYGGVLTGIYEEQQRNILAALEDVHLVVISDLDQPMWTYYSDELPAVQTYLERFFRIADGYPLDDASWIVVLERGPDRGESWLDLIEERPNARAWTRDEDRVEHPDELPPPRLVARHNRRSMPMRLGHWGGGIDYELTVPAEGGRFESGVGYRGMVSLEDLHVHPRSSDMVVEVGRDGVFEEIARQKVSDVGGAGRRWTPIAGDLTPYAGERITLRLTIDLRVPVAERDLTWWASPRVVRGPGAEPADGA